MWESDSRSDSRTEIAMNDHEMIQILIRIDIGIILLIVMLWLVIALDDFHD
jgi:hypothetical protein